MSPLISLKEGKTGSVEAIDGGGRLKCRLEAMGIRIGARVKKVSAADGHGPVVFISGRTQVALGRGMAAKIMVKEDK
jgi:ferrous iron transport protein A